MSAAATIFTEIRTRAAAPGPQPSHAGSAFLGPRRPLPRAGTPLIEAQDFLVEDALSLRHGHVLHGREPRPELLAQQARFAKQRLRQMRGIETSHFPLYLKECELRFNARSTDLIPVLAQALCSFVPRFP